MKAHGKPSDPIVDEIHRVRREIVNDAGGNLRALGEFLRYLDRDDHIKPSIRRLYPSMERSFSTMDEYNALLPK